MALNLMQYEEIVSLLQRVSGLVDKLEARDSEFADGVQHWLKDCEVALENNRIPAVSQIATGRAVLIQATRGVRLEELDISGRPSPRKVRDATAALVLQRGTDVLNTVIVERQAVFQEAERIARQVLAIAQAKGMIPDPTERVADREAGHETEQEAGPGRLTRLQRTIRADADLAGVYTHLLALVGTTDVLVFFDRALQALS
ncbi:hypothetical protein [Intrasporangium mesophilum]